MSRSLDPNRELTHEQLEDLKANACGILAETRRQLLSQKMAFVGNIALHLNLIPTRDLANPTAATDGKNIFFDIAFLASLNVEVRQFVLAHEVWHNVMMHFVRQGARIKEKWNIATDLEVNQILQRDGFVLHPDAELPTKRGFPDDRSAEEYYDMLMKDSNQGSGNGLGVGGGLDRHIYEGDSPQSENPPPRTDKYGKVGRDPSFMPQTKAEELLRNASSCREAAIEAAQIMSRQQGVLPSHIKNLVQNLLQPEIDWKERLAQFVTRVNGNKSTWSTPNRRYVWNNIYLPSHYGDKLKIAVGIDTSGSVLQDLPKFLGELNGLIKSFGNYELHVIQCDTEVKCCDDYDDENPLDLEHDKFEVEGLGGTYLHPIFDYVQDKQLDVDAMIVFTDAYCEDFPEGDAPEMPVMWMVTQREHDLVTNLQFGEVCVFKEGNVAD